MDKSVVQKLIILLFLAFLPFSAYSNDDHPAAPEANKLIGIWKLYETTTFYGSLTDPDSSNATTLSSDFNFTLTIKDDNTWTIDFVSFGETESSSGTWSSSGNTITIKEEGEPEESSDYSISGNKLTVTSSETIDGITTIEVSVFIRQ